MTNPPFDVGRYVRLAASEPVWRSLGRPGVTTVIGDAGIGKTALGYMIVRDSDAKSRRRLIRASSHPTFQEALEAARSELGGDARRRDVVIIDGLDDMNSVPSPEEVY